MALDFSTYIGLQDAIGHFLNRDDLVTSGDAAGFITLAEGTIRNTVRRKTAVQAFSFTSGTNAKALPNTVAEMRWIAPAVSVSRPRGGKALTYISYENFTEKQASLTGSVPKFYTVYNNTVYVAPAPSDDNLDFSTGVYTATVPVATDTSLLLEAPHLYLYGALVHSAPFLEHDERMQLWITAFQEAIEELNQKRQKEEFATALPAARLPVNFGGGRII